MSKLTNTCDECLADDTRPCICTPVRQTNVFGFKTIGSNESTVSYFDEETGVQLAPRFEFASQDWRAADEKLCFKKGFPSLNVRPDKWTRICNLWFFNRFGRNHVDVLQDFVDSDLPQDVKLLVFSFLNLTNGVKPFADHGYQMLFCQDVRNKYLSRTLKVMVNDQYYFHDGIEFWRFSDYYHGVPSYCSRCGEFQKGRRHLLMQGVCLNCGGNGLRFDYQHEFNDFTGDANLVTNRYGLKRHTRFVFVLGNMVAGMDSLNSDFIFEYPELLHAEWFTN